MPGTDGHDADAAVLGHAAMPSRERMIISAQKKRDAFGICADIQRLSAQAAIDYFSRTARVERRCGDKRAFCAFHYAAPAFHCASHMTMKLLKAPGSRVSALAQGTFRASAGVDAHWRTIYTAAVNTRAAG